MDDWKELESWHEDNGENLYERLQDFQNRKLSLQQETSTQPYAKYSKNPVEQ